MSYLTQDVKPRSCTDKTGEKCGLDDRIQDLGRKSNEGALTLMELADYETITRYVKFISVLQSKARLILMRVGIKPII